MPRQVIQPAELVVKVVLVLLVEVVGFMFQTAGGHLSLVVLHGKMTIKATIWPRRSADSTIGQRICSGVSRWMQMDNSSVKTVTINRVVSLVSLLRPLELTQSRYIPDNYSRGNVRLLNLIVLRAELKLTTHPVSD